MKKSLNKPECITFWASVLLYILISMFCQIGIPQEPVYYKAIEQNFYFNSVVTYLIPLIVIFMGWQMTSRYWFSSFREWQLLRNKKKYCWQQVKRLFIVAVLFTLISWILTMPFVKLTSFIGVTAQDYHEPFTFSNGLLYIFGHGVGMFIAILIAILINFEIMMVPLISNYCFKKQWQVFAFSVSIVTFLPILLFGLGIIPEQWVSYNLIGLFDTAERVSQLQAPFCFLFLVLMIEIILLYLINKYRERTSY
ncbi:hypothetical protein [Lactobacillus sp. ESL0703]|uniref:hypothetical protein n=1 Tax=Lactobacillus sp. ESL0703 TaxID=2983218 RepID=UPI0023F69934|nr:hypothetical protein [Lactobacillus sp. ESL0703]MDF7669541.1 hypothetical protein [Lactobacillus sp. ESL0703]